MIKITHDGGINFYEGISTDTKPVGKGLNGSIFYEMDTGKVYMFDEDNSLWRLQ